MDPGQENGSGVTSVVRLTQIITFALVQGVVFFGAVTLFLNQGQLDGTPEILTWMALGFSALMFAAHLVIPRLIVEQRITAMASFTPAAGRTEDRISRLFELFRTRQIITCAILEGGGFLSLVAYLVDKSWQSVASACVMIALIVVRFPTAAGMQFWAENKLREIEMR